MSPREGTGLHGWYSLIDIFKVFSFYAISTTSIMERSTLLYFGGIIMINKEKVRELTNKYVAEKDMGTRLMTITVMIPLRTCSKLAMCRTKSSTFSWTWSKIA